MSQTENTVLELRDISKRFGVTKALDGATLKVRPATVHGLVGENGAGKSTLIKILAGLYQPDSGSILLNGQPVTHLQPATVEALGIHFIHQDRLLPATLTVGEALFLGKEKTWFGLLNRRKMAREAERYLAEYFDIALSGHALIGELSTAEQQIVQITRALLSSPRLIVFDEPTAALIKREVDQLQKIILRLKQQGIAVIYISHYLQEIETLCDEVTILRNGKNVGTVKPVDVSSAEIARLMINRDVTEMYPKAKVPLGEVVLSVNQLGLSGHYQNVSFTVRQGEILGLTGLVGSGVKAVVESLFGLKQPDSGTIHLAGEPVRISSPTDAVKAGIGLVPEDRRRHGIATSLTVSENIALASLRQFSRLGFLSGKKEAAAAEQLIAALHIKTSSKDAYLSELSGGNQQKVAIAKWLQRDARVYVFDEPAVGVDVGAKVEIYRLIGELVSKGAAVILLTSDLLELTKLSDAIGVFYRGEIVRNVAAANTNVDEILAVATGALANPPAPIAHHTQQAALENVSVQLN
ncbi:ribose ABC transport system, ATP-binding protein RbsA [Aquitalea magnusonii]|uniref:Ribose ABC transport system, ATP-binding protein RbsA n=1 Tax=Aquitalea magnusonii TaxID=332411 RepID=A0A3G9GEB5_9NEIS|nr:sugar ABC transporter ATP-binding protein [Aquitalea magnusonii]BBF85153.1 ribose ABC transport system, ATP-binding protein RbsA [Aquitalea magnusonii]